MKLFISGAIFITFIFSCRYAKGQDTLPGYRHKLFAGYGYYFDDECRNYMVGYSYLNKSDEVVRFSLTYSYFKTSESGLALTVSYDIPSFPVRNNFNIYLSGQFKGYYEWQSIDKDHWRSGPFIGIGLIPAYTIAKRIDISIEPVVGIGYLWANQEIIYYGHFNDSEEGCVDCGITTFFSGVFRLGYWF